MSLPRYRQILCAAGLALLVILAWAWRSSVRREPLVIAAAGNADSTSLAEAGWPQFRGPTFDSISTEIGLAESWPEQGPPVLWVRELGQGYSGFAAVGNHVFTQSQSLYQQFVICLDARTGETLWTHNTGWPYEGGGLYPGPRSTPTWHDGRVYYSSPDGTVGCLDAATGHQIWSRNPTKQHHGRGTDFGYACSPVVIDNRVIVPVGSVDASVVALDVRDGSTVWKSGESSASYATPLPIRWRERSLVVTPLENSVAAFDVASGRLEWEIEFSQGYDEHSAAPIYQEPYLFISAPFRAGAERYRLDVDDSVPTNGDDPTVDGSSKVDSNPKVRSKPVITWKSLKFSNDVASSVLVDGRVYGFDLKEPQSRLDRPSRGEFRCLDFQTGREIWSTDQVGQANAIVADQKLILFNDRGELILAKLGTDEYVELARTPVFRDEICWSYPALRNGCIYLRTQTRAVCLYLGEEAYDDRRPVQTVQSIPRGRSFDAKWLIGGEREYPATVPDVIEFYVWYEWSLAALAFASLTALAMTLMIRAFQAIGRRDSHRHSVALIPPVPEGPSEAATPGQIDIQSINHWRTNGIGRSAFWFTAILAGGIGSPLINSRQDQYVLLWPLALWAVYQLTINVITWTERRSDRRRARWLSRGCGLGLIGVCVLYFHLCRSAGYAIEWSFLVGFLPAFLVAIAAARFLTTAYRFWLISDFAFSVISFSAYFWSSVVFIKWKFIVGS